MYSFSANNFPFTPPLVNVNLGVVGTFAYDRCIQNISFKTQLVEANSSLKRDIDGRDDLSRGTGGLTSSEAGMVLSAMGLANCCGRIGFGQALDWWKDKVKTFSGLFLTIIEMCSLSVLNSNIKTSKRPIFCCRQFSSLQP